MAIRLMVDSASDISKKEAEECEWFEFCDIFPKY